MGLEDFLQKFLKNNLRSTFDMGNLSVFNAFSSAVGAGIFSRAYINNNKGIKNNKPVKKGTHISEKPTEICNHLPTDFTTPEDTMKLTAKAAPIKSVAFRPSTNEKIIPHIIPNGKPFKNIQKILIDGGTIGKINNGIHESRTNNKISFPRPLFFNSEINFIPNILLAVYPST